MVTGAALATVNRLPVLLLPGDLFATHPADPVLQQLETPTRGDLSVNDAFIPVSRYFDRIWRPEQLQPAALVGHACVDVARRDRRGHARPAPRRAGRRLGVAHRAVRAPRLARTADAARRRRARACRRCDRLVAEAADRRRRRRDLQRGLRRARAALRADGHSGRRHAVGESVARVRPSAAARAGRRARHPGGKPDRARGRSGHRHRHPLAGLHDGLQLGVPEGGVRVGERRRTRLGKARHRRDSRCARVDRGDRRGSRGLHGRRRVPRRSRAARPGVGRRGRSPHRART